MMSDSYSLEQSLIEDDDKETPTWKQSSLLPWKRALYKGRNQDRTHDVDRNKDIVVIKLQYICTKESETMHSLTGSCEKV